MPLLTAAQTDNWTIEQGTTFRRTITWYNDVELTSPKDLTGYSARLQIRPTVASETVLLSLTSPSSGITLGTTSGLINLVITDTQTAAFSFTTAVYDLELVTNAGDVVRLTKGEITLDKEVTR